MCGLSVREVFLLTPGQVFDLQELYMQAHGLKKKDDYENDEGDVE